MYFKEQVHEFALGESIDNFAFETIWEGETDKDEEDNLDHQQPEEHEVDCVDHRVEKICYLSILIRKYEIRSHIRIKNILLVGHYPDILKFAFFLWGVV